MEDLNFQKLEKQKGRAQQGLEIEVFDYYTGLPRHVRLYPEGKVSKHPYLWL